MGSIRIALINRVAFAKPVQVHAAVVANRVPVDELARAGVVVAVRQAQEARLGVRVVAELRSEACGIATLLKFIPKELPAAVGHNR